MASSHRRCQISVAPVQIGLFLEIGVQVILSGAFIPFPGATAKNSQPVVGGLPLDAGSCQMYQSR